MEKMIGKLKQIEEELDMLKSLEASGHVIEGTSRKVNRKSKTVQVFLLPLLSLPGADLRLAFGGLISGSVPIRKEKPCQKMRSSLAGTWNNWSLACDKGKATNS